MSQGPCDHPSYLTRVQNPLGKTTAGANGTALITSFTNNQRIRNVSANVITAGTSATSGNQLIIYCLGTCTTFSASNVATQGTGTTSLGVIVLGTSAANAVATSGDLNATLNAGALLFVKNGTDATGVAAVTIESHLDPLGTWVTTNNG